MLHYIGSSFSTTLLCELQGMCTSKSTCVICVCVHLTPHILTLGILTPIGDLSPVFGIQVLILSLLNCGYSPSLLYLPPRSQCSSVVFSSPTCEFMSVSFPCEFCSWGVSDVIFQCACGPRQTASGGVQQWSGVEYFGHQTERAMSTLMRRSITCWYLRLWDSLAYALPFARSYDRYECDGLIGDMSLLAVHGTILTLLMHFQYSISSHSREFRYNLYFHFKNSLSILSSTSEYSH